LPKSKKRKPYNRLIRWSLRLGIRLFLVFVILTLLQVLILRFLNPPFTAAMAVRWVHHTLTGQAYQPPLYYWRDLNAISPYLRQAVLAGEDQRFLRHHGFDFAELNQAIKESIFSDRMRGASTITMQTARSVFLWPGRSLARKVLEAYYTGLIELVWTKKRILEMYLNESPPLVSRAPHPVPQKKAGPDTGGYGEDAGIIKGRWLRAQGTGHRARRFSI